MDCLSLKMALANFGLLESNTSTTTNSMRMIRIRVSSDSFQELVSLASLLTIRAMPLQEERMPKSIDGKEEKLLQSTLCMVGVS